MDEKIYTVNGKSFKLKEYKDVKLKEERSAFAAGLDVNLIFENLCIPVNGTDKLEGETRGEDGKIISYGDLSNHSQEEIADLYITVFNDFREAKESFLAATGKRLQGSVKQKITQKNNT